VRRAGQGSRWLLVAVIVLILTGCSRTLPPEAIPAVPPPPPPAPATPEQGKRLVVGVDHLGTGFNPHLISDLSPVSTAVAALVLPSVFRPGPNGEPVLDTTVASSAKVVSNAPFTVSYELSLAASWSDNTPIAAEDFVYLWQRMRTEPGVVDAAGYRLITDVRSRAGGKAVDVTFSQPYPQWQRLFSDLLPAHLLKDAPRTWATALADGIPVSGGPFVLSALDRDRGQLVLVRNDHYWATPAVLDSLILRRTDPTTLLDGLRTGDVPVAQVWPDQPTLTALHQLGPAARMQGVAQPYVVQLGMRTDKGVLADVRMRRAVGAALNRDALIAVGTGNGAGGVRADAQLLAPSEPGYHSTAPPGAPIHPDPGLVNQLLTSAGYHRDQQGRWVSANGPARIVVGAPVDQPRFIQIAQEATRQLDAAGFEAELVTAPGDALFTDPTVVPTPPSSSPASASPSPVAATPPPATPSPTRAAPPGAHGGAPANPSGQPASGQPSPGASSSGGPSASASPTPGPAAVAVDLEVMPRGVGGDLISTAVSNYGCPPGMAGVAQPPRNATGFCSLALQPTLDAALAGAVGVAQANATIESTLWQQLPAIPLFQPVTTLLTTARGDQATGELGPGPITIGPFGTAAKWLPLAQ
jgi:ABC-type transport system substrate-binding protein